MKIREDVQTLPIEIIVQSAGVSQEEQIFYTNEDDETEEQYWARKEAIRKNRAIDEPTVTIQTLSTNLVNQHPDIQIRLRRTNQIIIEQSKDAVPQQLKAKLLHEEYSENLLQQDARYRHYANNLERIVLKDEILKKSNTLMEQGTLNTIKFCSRNTYSRNCFSLFTGRRINILASQKCCRKFDEGITILAWLNSSKNG